MMAMYGDAWRFLHSYFIRLAGAGSFQMRFGTADGEEGSV